MSTETMPQPPPISRLPEEILRLFISSSGPDTLSAISLVCRVFYRLAFPLVHHTVSFKRTVRIKQFIRIVKCEGESTPLRISQALRCLNFCRELNGSGYRSVQQIDEDLIIEFKSIIPKLVDLERLSWAVTYGYNGGVTLFVDFQRWCPRLRSLDMSVRSGYTQGAIILLFTCFVILGLTNLNYPPEQSDREVSCLFGCDYIMQLMLD
jgi:hypothetical protein